MAQGLVSESADHASLGDRPADGIEIFVRSHTETSLSLFLPLVRSVVVYVSLDIVWQCDCPSRALWMIYKINTFLGVWVCGTVTLTGIS